MKSEKIKIRRGIFQGDALSPLLFCVCIIPVTLMLRKMKLGYMFGPARKRTLQKMITNLLFMDDMKIYAVQISNLKQMLDKAADIELGEEKCEIQFHNLSMERKLKEVNKWNFRLGKHYHILMLGTAIRIWVFYKKKVYCTKRSKRN